jgi:ABC-type transporter Mla subunit MlaD
MSIRHIFGAALLALLSACGGNLDLNLQLPSAAGLQPGSPVMLDDQVVGRVTQVQPAPSGGFVAKLDINPDARDQATQDSRFVVVRDPTDANRRRIELRPGQPGSPTLDNGSTVTGSIESEPLFRFGEMLRSFTEGLGALRDQVESFRSEMQRLPESEEAKQLKEEWQRLQEEMKQAQQATEDTLKKDLMPKLQQEMDALEKKLREVEAAARAKQRSI